jgi:hypothetical protein
MSSRGILQSRPSLCTRNTVDGPEHVSTFQSMVLTNGISTRSLNHALALELDEERSRIVRPPHINLAKGVTLKRVPESSSNHGASE